MNCLSRIQRALLILGLLLIAIFVAGYVHRIILSKAAVRRFEALREESTEQHKGWSPEAAFPVDFSLWSEKRVAAYQDSVIRFVNPPLALLRIPKLRLEAPVLEGTDELALNRGVGHIGGTSFPGQPGNVGIAGHRDGFFRVLKDIAPGDSIELVSPMADETFVVDQILLVTPDDVSVLESKSVNSLTLVTCYPFYFIGSAPQRYIVQASSVTATGVAAARQSSLRMVQP